MTAEERWAQQQEWGRERGELEINYCVPAPAGCMCAARQCSAVATKEAEVKRVVDRKGIVFRVCEAHVERLFDMYEDRMTFRGEDI